MKKLLLLIAFGSCALLAKAQSSTYHAFKVDVGFGYAIPASGSGTKAGVTFTVEPHYRVTDDLAVGLRFEGAGLGNEDQTDGDTHVKVSFLTSYCATGEYYLMEGGFRPFLGAGAGLFTQRAVVNSDSEDLSLSASKTKFGFFPRAGIEAGHFRFSASYNVLGDGGNYTAFSIGFFLGGGKK